MIYPELEGRLNGLAVRVPLLNASLAKVLVWYDNEFGYVHRMAELASMVARNRN